MPDDIDTRPLVVEMAIEPKSKADQEKLDAALADLAERLRRCRQQ